MTTPGGSCSTVTHVIHVGPTVVTDVRVPKGRGTRLDRIPFPEGSHITIGVAAQAFGVSIKTIRNKLAEHRDRLAKPHYRRGRGGRLNRILPLSDYEVLRTLFPVLVKK